MKLGVIGIAGAIAFGEMFALQAAEPPKQVDPKIVTAEVHAPPAPPPVRGGPPVTFNSDPKDQVASAAEPPKQVEKITTAAATAPDRPAGGPVRSGGKPTLNTPDQAKDQVASAAEPPKQVVPIITAEVIPPGPSPSGPVKGAPPKPTLNAPDKAKG